MQVPGQGFGAPVESVLRKGKRHMIETPRVVQTQALVMAKIYAKVPTSEIKQEMGTLLEELKHQLDLQGAAITGPWFTHHFQPPGEFFDFEVCFPVEKPVQPAGRMEPGEWPAMRLVRTVYTGPYTGLVAAWGDLMAWVREEGIATTDEAWERYLVDPHAKSDAARWQTELNRPLR